MTALTRRTLVTGGALTGLAATTSCLPGEHDPAPGGAHCFTGAEQERGLDGVRAFQQAFPPVDDTVGGEYRFWPCTDAATSQDLDRSSWTRGNIWAFVWANRCNDGVAWNQKPNPLPAPPEHVGALECRAVFTTHAKANAATRCQIRYLLGMGPTDYQAPWLALPGTSATDFVTDEDFRARPGERCRTNVTWRDDSYRVMVDTVLLPPARLTDGPNADNRAGVVLDYEVQDGRRPEVTESFVRAVAHDVRGTGKELFFFTNPFNAPTQQYTGCTPDNLPRIFADVDLMGVFVWPGEGTGSIPSSYDAQLAMLGPLTGRDHEKLVVTFELSDRGTTLEDARWLHEKLYATGRHPDKVMFWRNEASQGGPCSTRINRKISLVCFGE